MTARRLALALSLALWAAACATRADESWVREELWLGTEIPAGGEVSDAAWEAFLAEEVAPRFPAGFSVLQAAGHWRRPDGTAVRERTRVLVILHPGGDESALAAVAAIAAAYVERFGQDAALRTIDRVSAEFVESRALPGVRPR